MYSWVIFNYGSFDWRPLPSRLSAFLSFLFYPLCVFCVLCLFFYMFTFICRPVRALMWQIGVSLPVGKGGESETASVSIPWTSLRWHGEKSHPCLSTCYLPENFICIQHKWEPRNNPWLGCSCMVEHLSLHKALCSMLSTFISLSKSPHEVLP